MRGLAESRVVQNYPLPRALLSPVVPIGWSRGLNKPQPRYCNLIRQFSGSSREPSAGPTGASIRAPDDSGERTCRETFCDLPVSKPRCATTPGRNGRSINLVREKGAAPISVYSTANKGWKEIFLRPPSVPPSPELDETLGCLSQSKAMSGSLTTTLCSDRKQVCYKREIAEHSWVQIFTVVLNLPV